MGYEFTPEEIKEVIRVARVYQPGFSEEKLKNLLEMEKHLGEGGYLETVRGLAQLEQKGIPTTKALAQYQALLAGISEAETKYKNLQLNQQNLARNKSQVEEELRQTIKAKEQTQKELAETRAIRVREEQELSDFRQKTHKEEADLEKYLEQCRQKAKVTQADITTAGQIKAEVEAQGFSLQMVLSLVKELAGRENVRDELAGMLNKNQTLQDHITALEQQSQEKRKGLDAEINALQTTKNQTLSEIIILQASRQDFEIGISKLQGDLAEENELRRFFRRYQGVSGLMDCLGTWDQVFFLRCNNAVTAMAGVFNPSLANPRFWTDKPAKKCLHCGLPMICYDEKPYQALGMPVGQPLRIVLGE